jgi:hypothetical protein
MPLFILQRQTCSTMYEGNALEGHPLSLSQVLLVFVSSPEWIIHCAIIRDVAWLPV